MAEGITRGCEVLPMLWNEMDCRVGPKGLVLLWSFNFSRTRERNMQLHSDHANQERLLKKVQSV